MNRIKKTQCSRKDCSGRGDVIFRKVTIASVFGDELTGTMKPENGAYKNALVFYEASGVSFLYDSDGVYTKIANIEGETAGVISINGKQGVVTITLAELGGMTEAQINALITSKGYQTASQVDTKVSTGKASAIAESKAYTNTKIAEVESEIPTVNNATLTIKKNGTTVNTFTANSSTDKTANIEVPTKTTDLTNDAGYQTSAQVDTKVAAEATARAAAISAVESEIPDVVDNVTSTSSTNALSAKQGKLLNDRIDNIDSRGRYLSTWNATTGEPGTEPEVLPYAYRTGDYFIVATVGTTNYRPTGSQYTGQASTTVETDTVSPNDTYLYDGTTWELIHTEVPQIAIDENLSTTSRNAVWNSTITNALGGKVDKVTGKQLSTEDYTSAEKTKLSGVETGAEVNIIETVKVNGTALTPDSSRAVDVVAATPSDLALKQDALTAGDNITIDANNEISADVPELLTTTGQSTTAGMTQKAITDAIGAIEDVQDYVIKGAGAPTTSTVGTVGKLYEDTTNGDLYQCTAVSGSTYTWEAVGGGGGGQVLYDTVYGTNTDGSPTQAAISAALSYSNTAGNVRLGNTKTAGSYGVLLGALSNINSTALGPVVIGSGTSMLGTTGNIVIGRNALVDSLYSNTAVGTSSATGANVYNGTALGAYAQANAANSVALGYKAKADAQGQFDISTGDDTTAGYNNTNYRLLTGLHDPVNDHDAATKKYVDDHSGGGGVNVVQAIGSSTTDVMSQNAATRMIYKNASVATSQYAVNVHMGQGRNENTVYNQNGGIVMGVSDSQFAATYNTDYNILLGGAWQGNNTVESKHNILLGYGNKLDTTTGSVKRAVSFGSNTVKTGEFGIGVSGTDGYNGSAYRKITGVYDGENAHDALTVGQANALIDAINSAMNTSIPHIGAGA